MSLKSVCFFFVILQACTSIAVCSHLIHTCWGSVVKVSVPVFTLIIQHMLIFVCVNCCPETPGTKCAGVKAAERKQQKHTKTEALVDSRETG